MSTQLTDTPAWQALSAHHAKIKDAHLRQLFADDPDRAARFTVEGAGLFLDYSKNRITEETVALLVDLAKERKVAERRDAMFRGEKINVSENRAVLHVALRAPRDEVIEVDGHNVVPDVHAVLDRMAAFADKVRSGAWTGHTGKRIKNVINIGIGGSYLGPEMAYLRSAPLLRPRHDLPLRLQRGRRLLRRGDARSRRSGDAVHHLVQDLHHARDHDQRGDRARLGGRQARLGGCGGEAFRRRVHQHRGRREVRHRHRQHVRVLGLGRRPLFDGLGDRPVDHDRHRS